MSARRRITGVDGTLRELGAATRAHREAVQAMHRAARSYTETAQKARRTAQRVNAAAEAWTSLLQGIESDRRIAGIAASEASNIGAAHQVRGIRLREEGVLDA